MAPLEVRSLGTLSVPPIGLGTLNLASYKVVDKNAAAVVASIAAYGAGSLIDTAERYSKGKTETLVAQCLSQLPEGGQCAIATKFAPGPFRLTAQSVVDACEASISRLGVESVDLYQMHFPDVSDQPVYTLPAKLAGVEGIKNEVYWDGLAECHRRGLVKNVGVCNYGPSLLRKCHAHLQKQGVPLASNQFSLSLLNLRGARKTLSACRELGVAAVACYPLSNGALSGAYDPEDFTSLSPSDGYVHKQRFMRKLLREPKQGGGGGRGGAEGEKTKSAATPEGGKRGGNVVVAALRRVAAAKEKTCVQVALNWVVYEMGCIAIPGARTPAQVAENLGALGWRLDATQVADLEAASEASPEFVTARMHLLND